MFISDTDADVVYKVDKTRVNEFGQAEDEPEAQAAPALIEDKKKQ